MVSLLLLFSEEDSIKRDEPDLLIRFGNTANREINQGESFE